MLHGRREAQAWTPATVQLSSNALTVQFDATVGACMHVIRNVRRRVGSYVSFNGREDDNAGSDEVMILLTK